MNKYLGPTDDTFIVLTAPEAHALGIGDFLAPQKISLTAFKKKFKELTEKVEIILEDTPSIGNYSLNEITVIANITASGELQIVGTARGKSEFTGGLSLKFIKVK